MAKSPSSVALSMTNFLLLLNTWRYTSHGHSIINTIHTAANTAGSVTDAQYDSYTEYTAFRFATYVQHNALTI